MSSNQDNDGESVSYTFMELKDTARVNRACERWALLDVARNIARSRRGNAMPGTPARTGSSEQAWWEQ